MQIETTWSKHGQVTEVEAAWEKQCRTAMQIGRLWGLQLVHQVSLSRQGRAFRSSVQFKVHAACREA